MFDFTQSSGSRYIGEHAERIGRSVEAKLGNLDRIGLARLCFETTVDHTGEPCLRVTMFTDEHHSRSDSSFLDTIKPAQSEIDKAAKFVTDLQIYQRCLTCHSMPFIPPERPRDIKAELLATHNEITAIELRLKHLRRQKDQLWNDLCLACDHEWLVGIMGNKTCQKCFASMETDDVKDHG
jgi:hypothetical protein